MNGEFIAMSESTLRKPRTIKAHLQALALAALMVLLPLLLVEGLLQVIDPWGIRFFDDMAYFGTALENDAQRGYVLPDGLYQFSNWQATMENGTRIVPNTAETSDCEILVLGDSFTFGYGVDDAETWLSLIAADFPNVRFINAGITAYNSTNSLGTLQSFPDATAYVYLSNSNDWEPSLSPGDIEFRNAAETMPFIVRYGNYFYHRRAAETASSPMDAEAVLATAAYQQYFEDLQAFSQIENLTIISWEGSVLNLGLDALGIDYQAVELPSGHVNSFVDGHFDAEGNRLFAENLHPIFAGVVERACS
jgi:hypothetical protein